MIDSLNSLNNRQQILSVIGGVAVTIYLLLMIQILSAVQTIDSDRGPMVSLNLLDLEQPHLQTKPIKEKQKVKPKPKPPKPKKRMQPTEKVKAASPDVSKTATATETESSEDTLEESIPAPVPYFKLSDLPRFIHRETPAYPDDMRARGKTGTVELAVLIDKTGKVRQITILESAGDSFDQAAIEAIYASSFLPAKIQGKAVPAILKMPVKFKLL